MHVREFIMFEVCTKYVAQLIGLISFLSHLANDIVFWDKFGPERKRFSHQIGSVLGKLPSFNLFHPPQLNSFEFWERKMFRRKTRTKGESYYSINNLRSLRNVERGEGKCHPTKSDQHKTFHHAGNSCGAKFPKQKFVVTAVFFNLYSQGSERNLITTEIPMTFELKKRTEM